MTRSALSLIAVLATAPAFAGGYVAPPETPPVYVPPVATTDWTGFYGGVQFDYLRGTIENGGATGDWDGHMLGIFAGYRMDFGNIVLGTELDYQIGSVEQVSNGLSVDIDVNYLTRIGGEIGYDFDELLAYASIGYVHGEFSGNGVTVDDGGAFIGVGIDYMLSDSITVGAEANVHRFEDFGGTGADIDPVTVGLNMAFRF